MSESEARRLLRKMLAIHSLAFDADVTAESYPGAKHEEAEEAWCREVQVYLAATPAPAVDAEVEALADAAANLLEPFGDLKGPYYERHRDWLARYDAYRAARPKAGAS